MFEIPVLLSLIIPPAWKKVQLKSTAGRSPPAWCNTIIRILHIVVHASKITIIFFLGNKNHGILFLYILVIVCANLTSNAAIFKRIADMSLLIDFCNDYRTYLCWQVSSSLFSVIQVLMSICLNLSFLRAKKKKKNLHHQPPCVRLFDTIGQHIFLANK